MTKIKAVIFDMDGVLIDAREWHYEALNKALSLFGMEISRYDHLVTFDGLPTRKKLELLSLDRGLPRGLHEFINRIKQQHTMEQIFAKCKPTFYHEYAIAKLKEEGYKLAVGSNSVRKSVELMLGRAKILECFDVVLSNEDVKHPKPDPEMYRVAIERLGVQPGESLVVEDNEKGVQAAVASGAHLMKVDAVHDVNWQSIQARIREVEEGKP
ncbi:MAG: HAD family phosphatase [Candidatus Omnitrophica bacterium]|nr:HAD family phosphatase [Candidatus Omnitrophota bacterium]